MDRPITTLFMLMSVDGKISTGSSDELDVDRDFRRSPASGRVWIVLPDDRYIEMLIGFTKKEEAFAEMLAYSVVAGENK